MNAGTLRELLERCENADGPDRDIDAAVWLALTPGATRNKLSVPANEIRAGWYIDETRDETSRLVTVPSYTSSLDDSIALVNRVLPGRGLLYGHGREWVDEVDHACLIFETIGCKAIISDAEAPTGPLSICKAMLNALIYLEEKKNGPAVEAV